MPGPETDQPPVPPPEHLADVQPVVPAGTRTKAASGTSSSLAATRRGAQMRYFVRAADALAVLGFGAAAWKIAPQCGDPETRRRNLPLVVARFLILPWVRIRNLAVLTLVERRLPDDWELRYASALLKTFNAALRRNPGRQLDQGRRGPARYPERTRSSGQLAEAPAAGLEADPQKIDRHFTTERLPKTLGGSQ